MAENPPAINKTGFDCPYCGSNTSQYWYNLFCDKLEDKDSTPMTLSYVRELMENSKLEKKTLEVLENLERVYVLGKPVADFSKWDSGHPLSNINLSRCHHCNEFAVWINEKLVFPHQKAGPSPIEMMPDPVRQCYDEASQIVNLSPRGAAALLRLAIQHLCKELGESGKNINDDIGSLVAKGSLPRKIQQALDIVRVVGNNAVHPGEINLDDTPETALALFELVNLIVRETIVTPSSIETLYDSLPKPIINGIAKRDSKKK